MSDLALGVLAGLLLAALLLAAALLAPACGRLLAGGREEITLAEANRRLSEMLKGDPDA
jgi:hypothetical protein